MPYARRVTMTDWLLYQQSTCAMQTLILVWHFPKFRIFTFHIWLEIVLFFYQLRISLDTTLSFSAVCRFTHASPPIAVGMCLLHVLSKYFSAQIHTNRTCARRNIAYEMTCQSEKPHREVKKNSVIHSIPNERVYKWRKQLNCRKILGNQNIVFKLNITIIVWPSFVQSQNSNRKKARKLTIRNGQKHLH